MLSPWIRSVNQHTHWHCATEQSSFDNCLVRSGQCVCALLRYGAAMYQRIREQKADGSENGDASNPIPFFIKLVFFLYKSFDDLVRLVACGDHAASK